MKAGRTIKSGRALGSALGVNEKSIRKYLARDDWPARRSPPWGPKDLAAIQRWQKNLQEDRSKESDNAGTVSTGLKLERMLLTRVQRKRLEGQVIERAMLDRAMEGLAKCFVHSLDELERALPLQVAGLDPGQIEKVVHDRVRSIRESLASRQIIEFEMIEQAQAAASKPSARGRPRAVR